MNNNQTEITDTMIATFIQLNPLNRKYALTILRKLFRMQSTQKQAKKPSLLHKIISKKDS